MLVPYRGRGASLAGYRAVVDAAVLEFVVQSATRRRHILDLCYFSLSVRRVTKRSHEELQDTDNSVLRPLENSLDIYGE